MNLERQHLCVRGCVLHFGEFTSRASYPESYFYWLFGRHYLKHAVQKYQFESMMPVMIPGVGPECVLE